LNFVREKLGKFQKKFCRGEIKYHKYKSERRRQTVNRMVSVFSVFHSSPNVSSRLKVTEALAKITPASALVDIPIFCDMEKVNPVIYS
jgi:hypothetical protein